MKGVLLDLKSIDNGDMDMSPLKNALEDWQFFDTTRDADVVARAGDADIVVSNKVRLTQDHFDQLQHLKLVCVAATGTNNVDLDAAARSAVRVTNVTGYATPSVVQHVFGLILSLTVRLDQYRAAIRDQRWQRSEVFCLLDYQVSELYGKTLGIIGYGVLGKAVAQLGKAFGMEVLVAEHKDRQPREGRVALEQLLARSDVISLHCPLTPATENLIGPDELASMKPNALLVNAARGGIVDEHALAEALQQNRIGGAGIDVLTEEPPVNGNPLLDVDLPNLIVTPHIAWASVESRQRVINEVALNIEAFLKGEPRNVVA
ncbi:MAG: 2-hydroxyacid dehydrogenase [Gammaproteobacteria bacterium]|jgi:glycerate dehydrogenase